MHELGLCHPDIREIWLNSNNHPDVNRNTFMHELLHALSYVNMLDLNERQVDVLATMLIALARDNPGLLESLISEDKHESKSKDNNS
jgi:hypothetical protein